MIYIYLYMQIFCVQEKVLSFSLLSSAFCGKLFEASSSYSDPACFVMGWGEARVALFCNCSALLNVYGGGMAPVPSGFVYDHLTKSALEEFLFNVRLVQQSNLKELSNQQNLLQKYSNLKNEVTKIFVCPSKKCPAVLAMKKNRIKTTLWTPILG